MVLDAFRDIFRIPELRRRILVTLGLLAVYRVGAHVPVPGIDSSALIQFFDQMRGTIFGMIDLFAGGAFRRMSIFALGIMPYITASIIIQLLIPVFPNLEKLQREEEGRRKIVQYTRIGTMFIALFQSLGIAMWLENPANFQGRLIVPFPGWSFRLLTMITVTAGTAFLMWLGEQITEKGIGNGISLIIFAGIVARYPVYFMRTLISIRNRQFSLFSFAILVVFMVLVVAGVVLITQAQRKIPVQYARRVVGRRVFGGQTTYLPLRVNQAGVIPIIFAISILQFPQTITSFFGASNPAFKQFAMVFSTYHPVGMTLYAILIIFFTYFYTAITFNPQEIADNIKRYGGFIPGIRPGKATAEYLDRIMTRIAFPGGLYLAVIALLPIFLTKWLHVPFYFGGTSLLIVVGVALDTLQQIESHLLMRQYEGFITKGRLRGRF
ncbi:MAG TPA: preprotein translocase subunit SecY [bacterium]|nr:preprotein translocase subunit SecY [bacterium]HEX68294.1 preprotein translocase subunit SecY [bacterium]